eukprot:TRINITY_DN48132_c0_g1_i1.p1 TRINITY_DN48132_c0_g1~~TRINITY_DN48132_c0_g1_i1.p1  ORF type:complete len:337 (-),score=62.29 TRINITY_DN48132_c0_g1_i1:396-1406(-)
MAIDAALDEDAQDVGHNPLPTGMDAEWRVDAADGRAYLLEDFVLEYGGSIAAPPEQWHHSKLASQEDITMAEQDLASMRDAEEDDHVADTSHDGASAGDASSDEGVAVPSPPQGLSIFDMSGEPAEALSGIVEAMHLFGVSVNEAALGPGSLGVPSGSALVRVLGAIRSEILTPKTCEIAGAGPCHAGGLALLRGLRLPRDEALRRVLILTLSAGIGLRATTQRSTNGEGSLDGNASDADCRSDCNVLAVCCLVRPRSDPKVQGCSSAIDVSSALRLSSSRRAESGCSEEALLHVCMAKHDILLVDLQRWKLPQDDGKIGMVNEDKASFLHVAFGW